MFKAPVFRVQITDGELLCYPLAPKMAGPVAAKAKEVTDANGLTQCQITILPSITPSGNGLPRLAYAELLFPFAAGYEGIQCFQNGNTTNCVAGSDAYKNLLGQVVREVVFLQRGQDAFGLAVTSALRLFTSLRLYPEGVAVRFLLENKPVANELALESLLYGGALPGHGFLAAYAHSLAKNMGAVPAPPPSGYCSWSHLYREVSAQKLSGALAGLLASYPDKEQTQFQIDDGWQGNGSFSGFWAVDADKFPNGLSILEKQCEKASARFGLWLAPLLASRDSGFFNTHPDWRHTQTGEGQPEYTLLHGDNPIYALKLDEPAVQEHLAGVFSRAANEWGASYFKLDFLQFALQRISGRDHALCYPGQYCVELYRSTLQRIRQAVGEGAFLLACGAPIPEGAGIFNGIRVGPDITWGKSESHPSQWELIRMVTKTVQQRWFYHNILFTNDPDGLVLRDFDQNDGCDITYHEARLLATTIGLSGGAVLLNDQADTLSPARRRLYGHLLPVWGKAARPLDMMEPQPAVSVIRQGDAYLLGIYNWGDAIATLRVPLNTLGLSSALAFEAWEGRFLGLQEGELVLPGCMPHSAHVVCLRPVPQTPSFLFAPTSLYAGLDIFTSVYQQNTLTLTPDMQRLRQCENKACWLFLPHTAELPASLQNNHRCVPAAGGLAVLLPAEKKFTLALD